MLVSPLGHKSVLENGVLDLKKAKIFRCAGPWRGLTPRTPMHGGGGE